jgi:hypothetical protein
MNSLCFHTRQRATKIYLSARQARFKCAHASAKASATNNAPSSELRDAERTRHNKTQREKVRLMMTLREDTKGHNLPHPAELWHSIIRPNRIIRREATPLAAAAASGAVGNQQSPTTLIQMNRINTTRKQYY